MKILLLTWALMAPFTFPAFEVDADDITAYKSATYKEAF